MNSSASGSKNSALLLMDFHAAIALHHGEPGRLAVDRAAVALATARSCGIPVFHVVPHYREGYPELPSGEPFDGVRAAGLFREASIAEGIDARLAPLPGEAISPKCRYSPFFANDMLHLLHMRGVRAVVLAGIATSGVVLSAVRDAWDRDFKVTVLADACADSRPEVHRMLIETILPSQASVQSVQDWIGSLAG